MGATSSTPAKRQRKYGQNVMAGTRSSMRVRVRVRRFQRGPCQQHKRTSGRGWPVGQFDAGRSLPDACSRSSCHSQAQQHGLNQVNRQFTANERGRDFAGEPGQRGSVLQPGARRRPVSRLRPASVQAHGERREPEPCSATRRPFNQQHRHFGADTFGFRYASSSSTSGRTATSAPKLAQHGLNSGESES